MPLITAISTKPTFITPEEHREVIASTPNSFSDISPVLRYSEDNVKVVLDPALEGFTEEDAGSGTLYIIESVLAFLSPSGRGFEVQYPNITLHAISRDDSGSCVYCQLDELQGRDDDEESELNELKIIPTNPTTLEQIFEALSLCASLHPDKIDSDDEMGMDEAFLDANESGFPISDETELSEAGRLQQGQPGSTRNGDLNGREHSDKDSDSGQEDVQQSTRAL